MSPVFITAVSQMEAPRKHQFTGQTDSRLYIKMDPACPAGPKIVKDWKCHDVRR
uniref:Uncharacterized protein n=1 Tax=Anguilla anguilla TaxID=7936 RepID=A0A0E9PYX3_ANGAN